jgi:DNA-binding beta-propeller fold protein YncE
VVGTTISVGNFPVGIAITPDGKSAYVANEQSASVSVIDTRSNEVVGALW